MWVNPTKKNKKAKKKKKAQNEIISTHIRNVKANVFRLIKNKTCLKILFIEHMTTISSKKIGQASMKASVYEAQENRH